MSETEDLRGRSWVQDGDIAQHFSDSKSLNGHPGEIVVFEQVALRMLFDLHLFSHSLSVRILGLREHLFY